MYNAISKLKLVTLLLLSLSCFVSYTQVQPRFLKPFRNGWSGGVGAYTNSILNYFPVTRNQTNLKDTITSVVNPLYEANRYLRFSVERQAGKGVVSMTSGSSNTTVNTTGAFSYVPKTNAVGWDSVIFKVTDSNSVTAKQLPFYFTAYFFITRSNTDFVNELNSSNTSKIHPRLILNDSALDVVKNVSNSYITSCLKSIKNGALSSVNFTLPTATIADRSNIGNSSSSIDYYHLFQAAMYYRLNPDSVRFKNIVWAWLNWVTDSSKVVSWSNANTLDCPEVCHVVANCYDWVYNGLDSNQRKQVRRALYRNGVAKFKQLYISTLKGKYGFNNLYGNSNWNSVCHSGIIESALAIWDEPTEVVNGVTYNYQKDCAVVLQYANQCLPMGFLGFGPGGGWYEGSGYADWMIRCFLDADLSMRLMLKNTGGDFGITTLPGFYQYSTYNAYNIGPFGSMPAGDGEQNPFVAPSKYYSPSDFSLFIAKDANTPSIGSWFKKLNSSNGNIWGFKYYDDKVYQSIPSVTSTYPVDYYAAGVEQGFFHSKLFDSSATFLGFKAGSNTEYHEALDCGNFIFDCKRVRWLLDIGGETTPGFYGYPANNTPYLYYRKRAEAQNTLVFGTNLVNQANTSLSKIDQDATYSSKITAFIPSPSNGTSLAVLDLSSAYTTWTDSLRRGFKLNKANGELLIQDDIATKGADTVYSFFHTVCSVIIDASKMRAVLTDPRTGQQCTLFLLSPINGNAKLSVEAESPSVTRSNAAVSNDSMNAQFKKITVKGSNNTANSKYSILLRVLPGQNLANSDPAQIIPLEKWSADSSTTIGNLLAIQPVDSVKKAVKEEVINNVTIIPNPASAIINVKHPKVGIHATLLITGIDGKTILQQAIPRGTTNSAVNIQQLASGMYYLTVFDNGKQYNASFIK